MEIWNGGVNYPWDIKGIISKFINYTYVVTTHTTYYYTHSMYKWAGQPVGLSPCSSKQSSIQLKISTMCVPSSLPLFTIVCVHLHNLLCMHLLHLQAALAPAATV